MAFYKANDSYNASLGADYTVGDATLTVNNIPANVPTIVTVARDTDFETRFYVTGAGAGLLTGVTRKEGANVNISSGVSVECMIDDDFVNQLESAVFTQANLKGLVYAADGGASDTYAITLAVAPGSYTDILGLPISFKANTANTGAATLNVNSLGAKTIKKKGSLDLADNDIKANQIVTVIYDGTNFQLQYEGAPTSLLNPVITGVYDNGNSGTSKAIDWANGDMQKVTLTGNCTFTYSGAVAGQRLTLILIEDATGGRTITLPTSKYPSGIAPTYVTTANAKNAIVVIYDGTDYLTQAATGFA